MLKIRKADERGYLNHGWLDAYHTFSFGDYHDDRFMGFRTLRVMNEDRVAPGQGFGAHPHRDMEIVTCVLEGAIEHRDSMGNGEILRPGEFQRMTAGTGVTHSEFNPSRTEPLHLYQIWIRPERRGLEPSYEQKRFPDADKTNRLRLVASPTGTDDSLTVHTDAKIYLAKLEPDAEVVHALEAGRHAWLQVLRGGVDANGQPLATSDGAAVSDETQLTIAAREPAEIMLIDLP